MNRLLRTEILLAAVVLLLVANLVETKRLENAVNDVWSSVNQLDSNSMTFATDLKNSLDRGVEAQTQTQQSMDCIANPYQLGCTPRPIKGHVE